MLDQNKKSESQSNIIHISNWNSTPSCVNHAHYRKLIRKQVTPFTPDTKTHDSVQPSATIGNHRKLIDFQSAQLTEADKRYHIKIMVDMLDRIAYCRNVQNHITEDSLYILHEHYLWTCPETSVRHSERTPLTIDFLVPIFRGGRMVISNIRPVYHAGWLPGFYRWHSQPTQAELSA